ncbi:hypothetical protein EXS56_02295 [Candidatus Kaiserbacteria bacterium]|nr:hypothetical protein [Candidatus Kaiserbacteria bacterium]
MMNLERLRTLVQENTRADGNDFYRRLYGMESGKSHLEITSIDDWRMLPFLSKQDIVKRPFKERPFIPFHELQTISVTSGTTGGPPLFQPRSYQGTPLENLSLPYPDIHGATLAGILQFPHEHERAFASLKRNPRVIHFDPQHIQESVTLALIAGVEIIIAQSFFVSSMCEVAAKSGLAERVKLIIVAGETWTRSEFLRIRGVFKNAKILYDYGTKEAGTMAYTEVLGPEYAVVYRPMPHVYFEIFDSDTGLLVTPDTGVVGELLLTTTVGEPSAFPLLRYRSGDCIRVESVSTDGTDFTFTLLGRVEQDFIKIPGGMLRADELERVVGNLSEEISDRFEAHCFEQQTPEGLKKHIVMHVQPLAGVNLDRLADTIAEQLHLGPSFTYSDGVQKGGYLPLTCVPLTTKDATQKHKRIVKHW